MNYMKDVAKLLGVEIGEEFEIRGYYNCLYKFTKDGLDCYENGILRWTSDCPIEKLLTGECEIIKLPKPILDDIEKKYLSRVIRPFIKKVNYIVKSQMGEEEYNYQI